MKDRNMIYNNNEKLKALLIYARKLIENKDSWIKGKSAADMTGFWCSIVSPLACQFCSSGALINGFHSLDYDDSEYYLTLSACCELLLHDKVGKKSYDLIQFNDAFSTTHEDVLKLFDDAIKRIS